MLSQYCKPTHDEFCAGGQQDSAADLLAYFGPNTPDTLPPAVEITAPVEDVLKLPLGGTLEVEVDVTDDHEGSGWKLEVFARAEPPAEGEDEPLQSFPALAARPPGPSRGFRRIGCGCTPSTTSATWGRRGGGQRRGAGARRR